MGNKAQQEFPAVANIHLLFPFSLPLVHISVLTDTRLMPSLPVFSHVLPMNNCKKMHEVLAKYFTDSLYVSNLRLKKSAAFFFHTTLFLFEIMELVLKVQS